MFPIFTEIISTIATLVPKIIEVVGKNILQFSQVISGILKGLGLINPDEEVTDIGDKAIQAEAEGVNPENYDSYEEYLKAVEEFETDPEKSLTIDDGKKLEKGVEVITATLLERYGDIMKDFLMLIAKNPTYFEKRMPYFADLAQSTPATFEDITRYVQGKENDTKKSNDTLRMMYDVEKKVAPEKSLDDLMMEIEKLKD